MANTYSQIFLQFVFAVKYREHLIPPEHKEQLHQYIGGLVRKRKSKMLAVHCMPDHTHLFVGYKPVMSISDFIKEIKVETNLFINDHRWINKRFSWQEGYGVFSYSNSHVDSVIRYIRNQEEHHRKSTFKREYYALLTSLNISFDDRYLFNFFD